MPEAPTPEMLKRMKVEVPGSSTFTQPSPPSQTNGSSSKGKLRQATIEDEEDEDSEDEDVVQTIITRTKRVSVFDVSL